MKAEPESAAEQQSSESEENATRPPIDQIAGDCVGFLRSTKTVPQAREKVDCPECPATGDQVLKFEDMHEERVSCSGPRCEVDVAISGTFIPSPSLEITGGLVGWIPVEQRTQYLHGQTPSGKQVYHVMITYTRENNEWRAVEFDRR